MSSNIVNAQVNVGAATLGLTLVDVLILVVDDVAPLLTFDEQSDYSDGVSYSHISGTSGVVTSTSSAWDLSVSSATANFVGTGTIPVSTVTVTASNTTGALAGVALSTTEQTIVDEGPAGLLKPFLLTYSTQANEPAFISQGVGAYTAVLTYTATAD